MDNPMTRKGFYRLAEEHRSLLQDLRPKVVQGVADAAAEGDRSENAEYIYGKKRLREIDKKLRQLTNLMKDVRLVDPENLRSDSVVFGATVSVTYNGEKKTWMIVGVGEANADEGTISWRSPVAKAMIGKKVGDEFIVYRPTGDLEGSIHSIAFRGQPPKVMSRK